jgi:hypothetical protein
MCYLSDCVGIDIACAGVGVRAGRDASGQFHRAIVLQKFASPSPNGDKDERGSLNQGVYSLTPRS